MKIIALSLAGIAICAAAAWSIMEYRANSICAGLEEDYLNAVSNLKHAAQTKAVAMQFGSSGEAHDLAMDVNARAITYYLGQIYDRCGSRASDTASRKGRDMIF